MVSWNLNRVPEPEVMDDSGEIESYQSAASEQHLNAIDDTFVEHLLRLADIGAWAGSPLGLDIGTGPGQIPIKILRKFPRLKIIGTDLSIRMLDCAQENAQQHDVADRLLLLRANGNFLPFPDGAFSIVCCNSVLHHAKDPVGLIGEMFRVAAPEAPVLLRDLRRPPGPFLNLHLACHGRNYQGRMRRIFEDSVRAAYTQEELTRMVEKAQVAGMTVFRYRGAHIGIERAGRKQN